jgi:hypothetical protein
MAADIGNRINEHVLNDIQNSLDYKSKMMMGERFAERTNQILKESGIDAFDPEAILSPEIAKIVGDMKQNGYHTLGQVLDQNQLDEIISHFDKCDIYRGHFASKSNRIPRKLDDIGESLNASYSLSDIINAPHIIELANDPRILAAASAYIGCLPSLFSVNVYWPFADAEITEKSIHGIHRDQDDFKFCSFFVYLSDCDKNDGAHQYIRSTHRPDIMEDVFAKIDPEGQIDQGKFFSTLFEQGDRAYEQLFGDMIDYLQGKPGDGFITDPWGLHRACPNITNDRRVIWIRYGLYRNSAADRIDETPVPWDKLAGRIGDTPTSRYFNRLIVE